MLADKYAPRNIMSNIKTVTHLDDEHIIKKSIHDCLWYRKESCHDLNGNSIITINFILSKQIYYIVIEKIIF